MSDYPCPCCGHLTFSEGPGSHEICDICFWEDDPVQLRWPMMGGANIPLIEAQRNYQKLGAKEERVRAYVRKPTAHDRRDPRWRPIDLERDGFEPTPSGSYFDAVSLEIDEPVREKYYWRR